MSNKADAIKIIKRLTGHGYRALLAGGCVRDMLINRPAKDYDVATSATPEQVIALFERTIKVGAKFGVVMVMFCDRQTEVATFRTEYGYADGRHPDHVSFSGPEKDAQRRDFTINGMFYDPLNDQVIDYVNGRADLEKKILRTIGSAQARFGEDYLRMLRAVRFSTELGYEIEPDTYRAIKKLHTRITAISAERIAMELETIITHPSRTAGLSMLLDTGLLNMIFPNLERGEVDFGFKVLDNLPDNIDFSLGLAAMFAGSETDLAAARCRSLKLSNTRLCDVKFLLKNRSKLLDSDMPLSQLRLLAAEPLFNDLCTLEKAIQKTLGKSAGPVNKVVKRARDLEGIELKPAPLLDGHQLIALGVRPGPEVGHVSRELYLAQLEEQVTTREQAREWVKKRLAESKKIQD